MSETTKRLAIKKYEHFIKKTVGNVCKEHHNNCYICDAWNKWFELKDEITK